MIASWILASALLCRPAESLYDRIDAIVLAHEMYATYPTLLGWKAPAGCYDGPVDALSRALQNTPFSVHIIDDQIVVIEEDLSELRPLPDGTGGIEWTCVPVGELQGYERCSATAERSL